MPRRRGGADRDGGTFRGAACQLNRDVHGAGPVILAFGDADVVDRSAGILVIKPSALACDAVEPADVDETAGVPGGVPPAHTTDRRGGAPHRRRDL